MYEYEEDSDIIGLSCTLLNPYKGYMEGTIVGDYGLQKTVWEWHTGKCKDGWFLF